MTDNELIENILVSLRNKPNGLRETVFLQNDYTLDHQFYRVKNSLAYQQYITLKRISSSTDLLKFAPRANELFKDDIYIGINKDSPNVFIINAGDKNNINLQSHGNTQSIYKDGENSEKSKEEKEKQRLDLIDARRRHRFYYVLLIGIVIGAAWSAYQLFHKYLEPKQQRKSPQEIHP